MMNRKRFLGRAYAVPCFLGLALSNCSGQGQGGGQSEIFEESPVGVPPKEGNDDPTLEWIPLCLAFTSIVATALFTAWVIIGIFLKPPAIETNEAPESSISKLEKEDDPLDAERQDKENPVMLSWRGISCRYKSNKPGHADKITLSNAYGEMRAGEVTAVMGASGAGKCKCRCDA